MHKRIEPVPCTGLVLGGGGARAAYQVGVLSAIAQIRREAGARGNPFPVITGTSAGAINAVALACGADRFDTAVDGLVRLWAGLTVEQVYRADALGVVRSGARWIRLLSLGWAFRRWQRSQPQSLLDNAPLRELLAASLPLARLPALLRRGRLRALAITASSYSSGQHCTFFQSGAPVEPWLRTQRIAVPAQIGIEHLMASSAIPFVFPAQPLPLLGRREWFGDGSMRQSAPISPAVHLGAERVLVIGAGRIPLPGEPDLPAVTESGPPSLAQVAGHALASIFLDALAVDIERLQRINKTLMLLPAEARMATPLRPVQVLVIAPSQRLDTLAAKHQQQLPKPMRALLGSLGVQGSGAQASGSALASYLLFVPGYTTELITLGLTDTLARRDEVMRFFGWEARAEPPWQRLRREGLLPPSP